VLRNFSFILVGLAVTLFLPVQGSIRSSPHNGVPYFQDPTIVFSPIRKADIHHLLPLKEEVQEGEYENKEEMLYQAWVSVEHENSFLKIKGFCFNNTEEEKILTYKLFVQKSGKTGTVNTSQAGIVKIPGKEKKYLSQLYLSFSPTDYWQIKLEIYKDDKLVAEASLLLFEEHHT